MTGLRRLVHRLLRPLMRPLGKVLERKHMRAIGTARTGQIARAYNGLSYGPARRYRTVTLQTRSEVLFGGNGAAPSRIRLDEGFAVDDSQSLPHLDRLREEMDEVIRERGAKQWHNARPFLQNILPADGTFRYQSLIDFASTPEVVGPIARHFGFIPHLSYDRFPPGVRVMESSVWFDPQPEGPYRSSQLWHLDYHSSPTFYVIVLLRETTDRSGPMYYLSKSTSDRVAKELGYGSRRAPYRVADEVMSSLVDPDEVMKLCGPPGTVMFIDSSVCFHFGSRNAVEPRYQVQYAYISPVRNDFADILREPLVYPLRDEDSELRRLVMDRALTGD